MIVHIVLFRPRSSVGIDARRTLANAFREALAEIGSIRRARIGRRRTHGRAYEHLMTDNYTHAAILEFDDLQGLQSYLEHPAHEVLASQFFACFEQALMYDFELGDGAESLDALIDEE